MKGEENESVIVFGSEVLTAEQVAPDEVVLVANGDLRQSANQVCWAAQANLEKMLSDAFLEEGIKLRRAHPYNPELKHGFIHCQRMGMDTPSPDNKTTQLDR